MFFLKFFLEKPVIVLQFEGIDLYPGLHWIHPYSFFVLERLKTNKTSFSAVCFYGGLHYAVL